MLVAIEEPDSFHGRYSDRKYYSHEIPSEVHCQFIGYRAAAFEISNKTVAVLLESVRNPM